MPDCSTFSDRTESDEIILTNDRKFSSNHILVCVKSLEGDRMCNRIRHHCTDGFLDDSLGNFLFRIPNNNSRLRVVADVQTCAGGEMLVPWDSNWHWRGSH